MMGNRECESSVAGLLERHFEVAFSAPEGVKKLRELILTLAMKGKLVPQNPNDQPASELLKEIEVEKLRLVKEGKIKPPKSLPPVRPDEFPYDLPTGWVWARLGDIGNIGSSSRVHQRDWQDEGIPFYRAREIVKLSKDGFVDNELFISENLYNTLSAKGMIPQADDIMITGVGTIGVPYVVRTEDKFYFKDASVLIFKNQFRIYSVYLCFFFESPYWNKVIHEDSMGTTVHTLTISKANDVLIPLPPLAEQQRIVARIDELMARCDALETLRAERDEKRIAVHAAAMKQLLDTQDAEASAKAWRFISRNFGELYAVRENVAELRKAILQLAVMGKLVPQDPNDPPASELLKEIEKEKLRLEKEGKAKKQKPLPPIKPDEAPYELPKGWEWVRLGTVTSRITDGDHKTPPRTSVGRRLLSAKNVRDGYLDFENCDFISDAHYQKSRERCLPEKGDLLIVSVGGTIGRTSLVPDDSDFALVRSVALIKPLFLDNSYLKHMMDSELLQTVIHKRKRGGAQPCLYLSEIEKMLVAFSPLSEQHRIVARVDELMTLCDTLELQLNAKKEKQTELLYSIMV